MRRSDPGNLRNVPKLRYESRLLHCLQAGRLAQTAPTISRRVHSCLPFSTHPPSKTLSSELANAGQQHQLHWFSNLSQTDAHGLPPQGDLSWSSPSVTPAHPRIMDSRGNPARATQVFSDAGVDHGQSDDCLGNAATLHDAHVWARKDSSGIPDIKNDLAQWQRLMVLSQRTCRAQLPHTPSSCGKLSRTESCSVLCWCLSHLRWSLASQLSVIFATALASAYPELHSVLST